MLSVSWLIYQPRRFFQVSISFESQGYVNVTAWAMKIYVDLIFPNRKHLQFESSFKSSNTYTGIGDLKYSKKGYCCFSLLSPALPSTIRIVVSRSWTAFKNLTVLYKLVINFLIERRPKPKTSRNERAQENNEIFKSKKYAWVKVTKSYEENLRN